MAQHSTDVALRALCLFDGYGGFELGLRSVARVSTVCRVERDAHAAAVLVARMEEERLDPAPIWDDVCTFDGRPWRGRVDLVTAGFPCQPFSGAGRQAGLADDRWLWPQIARILDEVRPGYVFLENVRGLVRHGLPEVLSDLAALGFDAEWSLLSAAAVGASHKRERVWLVAHCRGTGSGPYTGSAHGDEGENEGWSSFHDYVPVGDRSIVADALGVGQRESNVEERPFTWRDSRQDAGWRSWPPGPDDYAGWRDYIAQGGPEPVVRRSTDGPPPGLADALHLGGNGLVPQCAAQAWLQLTARLDLSLN